MVKFQQGFIYICKKTNKQKQAKENDISKNMIDEERRSSIRNNKNMIVSARTNQIQTIMVDGSNSQRK